MLDVFGGIILTILTFAVFAFVLINERARLTVKTIVVAIFVAAVFGIIGMIFVAGSDSVKGIIAVVGIVSVVKYFSSRPKAQTPETAK